MQIPGYTFQITVLVTLVHCIIGNAIGIYSEDPGIWGYLFLPYTVIAGMSQYHGWDGLLMTLELVSLAISLSIFYPIVAVIRNSILQRKSRKNDNLDLDSEA